MTDRRNLVSEFLCDEAQRLHLMDYLASMYESVVEITEALLTLDHGNLSDAEVEDFKYAAATGAMNLLADMKMTAPMLVDIYPDEFPL